MFKDRYNFFYFEYCSKNRGAKHPISGKTALLFVPFQRWELFMVEKRRVRRDEKPVRSRSREEEAESNEEHSSNTPKRRSSGSKGASSPRKGKAPTANNNALSLILMVATVLLLVGAGVMYSIRPKATHTKVFHNAEAIWKEAETIGKKGLYLYQEGLTLRDNSKTEEANKKFAEAYEELSKAVNKGNDAIYMGLCIQLNMNKETSELWVGKFLAKDRLETFDEFLVDQKAIAKSPENQEIFNKWKKGTGGLTRNPPTLV
jgi:hypothetical protein